MMNIYILSGPPASGKTTYSQELAKQNNIVLYSYDELKKKCKSFYEEKEVRKQMIVNILKDLANDKDVILDDLNITKNTRTLLLKHFQQIPCKKICISMTTSLEECLLRDSMRVHSLPQYLIKKIFEKYETPTFDEGWDEILYY